jgi:predicted GNAT family acetyltransferase
MKVTTHAEARSFLRNTQAELESNEAANSLILGAGQRLATYPERIETAPCLKTVEDDNGLVLAAMMTPPHKLLVYGHQGDLDGGTSLLVADLLDEGWMVPGVMGPREAARCVVDRWVEIMGKRYRIERRQRVYELRQVKMQAPGRGRLRPATEGDIELVARWWFRFNAEIFGEADRDEARRAAELRIKDGDVYLWEDPEPVSMALKTRPTQNGVSVSGVYTPPDLRGRGYATACVCALSRLLLESGCRYCALFADLSNAAAIRVYEKVGYQPTWEYDEYAFLDEE